MRDEGLATLASYAVACEVLGDAFFLEAEIAVCMGVVLQDVCLTTYADRRLPRSLEAGTDEKPRNTNVRTYDLSRPPVTQREAYSRPDADEWRASEKVECTSLRDMGTFETTTLPPGRRAISLRWVYAYKYDENGKVISKKSRVVACGDTQRSEDFNRTYAPVP